MSKREKRGTGVAAAGVGVVLGTISGAVLTFFVTLAAAIARGISDGGKKAGPARPEMPGEPKPLRPGWSRPLPEHLVKPTYWPMVLALGITFLLWGLISNLFISGVGVVLFALALTNWIRELRHDP